MSKHCAYRLCFTVETNELADRRVLEKRQIVCVDGLAPLAVLHQEHGHVVHGHRANVAPVPLIVHGNALDVVPVGPENRGTSTVGGQDRCVLMTVHSSL